MGKSGGRVNRGCVMAVSHLEVNLKCLNEEVQVETHTAYGYFLEKAHRVNKKRVFSG